MPDMKTATRGIINFTMPDCAYGSRRQMFSYGYLLASLLSYRISHVRNACARLLVYLRDISHYQGEPSVDHREEGRAREGKRNGAFIFSFYPTNVLAHIDVYTHTHTHTHARARARAHLIQTGDLNTHENLHSCTLELIGIAVWVRVIAGSQTRRYRPLPVRVSVPANTFLLLRVRSKWTHLAAS